MKKKKTNFDAFRINISTHEQSNSWMIQFRPLNQQIKEI